MFSMSVPWWEFVVRGVAVYLFLLVFLRLTGRRQTGQYAPFDLVLLLILSNAVQNSMNAGDNSLIGGMIVKVGSRQIDTSLRTKLSTLKLALKEVG